MPSTAEAGRRRLELEGAGSAEALLARYDRAAGRWDMPKAGEFWEAVAEAHARGHTGRGARVAVLDSAFDLTIPQLAAAADGGRRMAAPLGEPTSHGTAVALLILSVAPNARLDLYEVTAGGEPDAYAVRAAIEAVSASGADVACLSLGVPNERDEVRVASWEALETQGMLAAVDLLLAQRGDEPIDVPQCPSTPCLCLAAQAAAKPRQLLVAAAGNDRGSVFCPARHPQVVSVGFQQVTRELTERNSEVAYAGGPSFSQSFATDLTINQPEGVLGSSFAAPLAAGAATLGLEPESIPGMAASGRLGAVADFFLALAHQVELPPPLSSRTQALYGTALDRFPHLALLLAGDHWCMGCALFGRSLLANAGLASLMSGDLETGEELLRAARRLTPTDPHAAANLARLLYARVERGVAANRVGPLCREALTLYDEAVALRPGYTGYDAVRAEIARVAASAS